MTSSTDLATMNIPPAFSISCPLVICIGDKRPVGVFASIPTKRPSMQQIMSGSPGLEYGPPWTALQNPPTLSTYLLISFLMVCSGVGIGVLTLCLFPRFPLARVVFQELPVPFVHGFPLFRGVGDLNGRVCNGQINDVPDLARPTRGDGDIERCRTALNLVRHMPHPSSEVRLVMHPLSPAHSPRFRDPDDL